MHHHTQDTNAAATTGMPRSAFTYSALLATALLCACTTGSSWKSNSAMSSSGRTAKATTAAPETETGATVGSVSSAGPRTSDSAAGTSASGTTSGTQSNASAAGTAARSTPDATAHPVTGGATGGATAASEPAAHASTAAGADVDHSAGAMRYGEDDGFSDEDSAAASDASPQPLAGSLTAGASPSDAGAQDSSLAGTQGRAAGAGGGDTPGASGADTALSGAQGTDPARGASGASSDGTSAQAGTADTSTGGAAARGNAASSAAQAEAQGSTRTPSSSATEVPGSTADRSTSSAGSESANIAAAAARGSSESSGQGTGEAAGVQAAIPPEIASGMVEAPGKQATRREVVIPQTLGGMLPLTLGIDGQGEFDFDKAVLREQVRQQLDDLAARLQVAEYDRLEIVGHTDRIGTEDYNQYLSERRAWAVARYLVDHGVPASKIRVEGRGMHEPMTPLQECNDQLGREQLIACLQLDRRVVISASIRKVDVKVQ